MALEEFLTVKEVAKMLKRSSQEIYRMVYQKKIPYTRISPRGIRFRMEDFQQWVRFKSVMPDQYENILSVEDRIDNSRFSKEED